MGQFVEQGYEFDLTADEVDRRLMLIGDFSRPNLLHNSRFQVNQRSLPISSGVTTTSIANNVANNVIMAGSFIVDRWHTVNPDVVYTLDAGHYIKALNSDGTNGGASLKQKIWSPRFLNHNSNIMFDKDITVSILYSDGNLFTGTGHTVKHADFTSANEGAIVGGYISAKDNDNNTVAFIICRKDTVSKSRIACAFELHIMGRNTSIIATKVEIGVGQTLAKKVGNQWVLIDQYNYDEDLKNCQRFYRICAIPTHMTLTNTSNFSINQYLSIPYDIDADMVFLPSVVSTGKVLFVGMTDSTGLVKHIVYDENYLISRIHFTSGATRFKNKLCIIIFMENDTFAVSLGNRHVLVQIGDGGSYSNSVAQGGSVGNNGPCMIVLSSEV